MIIFEKLLLSKNCDYLCEIPLWNITIKKTHLNEKELNRSTVYLNYGVYRHFKFKNFILHYFLIQINITLQNLSVMNKPYSADNYYLTNHHANLSGHNIARKTSCKIFQSTQLQTTNSSMLVSSCMNRKIFQFF